MSTLQHDTTMAANCYAADLLWDEEMATVFRQICQDAVGRDCLCEEGGPCSLMDAALKGVITPEVDVLGIYMALDADRKHLLADEAARLIEDQRAAKV